MSTKTKPKIAPVVKNGFYRPAQRKEWIESEDEPTAGLRILVRTDITNAEQDALKAQHRAITTYQQEVWSQLPPEEQDLAQSPRAKELALLAPYIYDWNVVAANQDGDLIEVAAPVVNGPAAFDVTGPAEQDWMIRTVIWGYELVGKAIAWLSRSNGTGDTSEPETVPETPAPNDPSAQTS